MCREKSQIPSTKFQIKQTKPQNLKTRNLFHRSFVLSCISILCHGLFRLRFCLLFVCFIWNLGFGVWNFPHAPRLTLTRICGLCEVGRQIRHLPGFACGLMDPLDRLLEGISVYQDVVLDGRTARTGVRDCAARWAAIAPHLPARGALLDIGANFAWFCLRWCAEGRNRTAVALEADPRTGAVARHVLASHADRRIALVTALAGASATEEFRVRGDRFAAALCLSVLHWIPDHREFLTGLGRVADRIFIEHCDPREEGAGVDSIRREIGEIGPYLTSLFPDRPVERIAVWNAHRSTELPRELWSVGPASNAERAAAGTVTSSAAGDHGTSVGALLALDVAWPPRSWFTERLQAVDPIVGGEVVFTGSGVERRNAGAAPTESPEQLLAGAKRIPERGVVTWRRRWRRVCQAVRRRIRAVTSP
jgi:hypothetical protein